MPLLISSSETLIDLLKPQIPIIEEFDPRRIGQVSELADEILHGPGRERFFTRKLYAIVVQRAGDVRDFIAWREAVNEKTSPKALFFVGKRGSLTVYNGTAGSDSASISANRSSASLAVRSSPGGRRSYSPVAAR